MMKKRAMTNKQLAVVPQGYKNGGKVKVKPGAGKESRAEEMAEAKAIQSGKMSPTQYADMEAKEGYANGGLVRANNSMAPNACTYSGGPGVRSQQDYRK